jgi:predicted DNA binding CopG/RHH family protein
MNQLNFDDEEQEILDAYESGNLTRSARVKEEIAAHREAATVSIRQKVKVSVRLSSRDVRALQAKALKDGLSYQALASSILHKYAEGLLTETP